MRLSAAAQGTAPLDILAGNTYANDLAVATPLSRAAGLDSMVVGETGSWAVK